MATAALGMLGRSADGVFGIARAVYPPKVCMAVCDFSGIASTDPSVVVSHLEFAIRAAATKEKERKARAKAKGKAKGGSGSGVPSKASKAAVRESSLFSSFFLYRLIRRIRVRRYS
jgi:hypothetical protein